MKRPKTLFKARELPLQKQFSCRVPGPLLSRITEVDSRLAAHGEKVSWSATVREALGTACDTFEKYCDQLDKEGEQAK